MPATSRIAAMQPHNSRRSEECHEDERAAAIGIRQSGVKAAVIANREPRTAKTLH
jgi:hypothetical protein